MTHPQSRLYQVTLKGDIYNAWDRHANVMAVSPTGSGKCLGENTPVLMYDGIIKMVQDVSTGDQLMGPDSMVRDVLSVCSGREMLYKVTPVKGEPYVVNESHILSLRMTGTEEIVNISVTDYLKKSNTFRHCAKGWRTGIEFFYAAQPVPAYIVGVWLGDGTSIRSEITSVDTEVIGEWWRYANSIDCTVTTRNADTCPTFSIKSNSGKWGGNKFRNFLQEFNLSDNKHIPHSYKIGNTSQRLELLAGLIDTDGYLGNGIYDVIFKQEELARDMVFVARSVGLAAYVKPCKKTCTNTGAEGDYWRICISGDLDIIPCRVVRRMAEPRKQKKNVLNVGIKVEPIGVGDYYGFEITGDRLFLLGDFTVTHNTFTFAEIMAEHDKGGCAAIAHRQELVAQISLALNKTDTPHRIVAPDPVIRYIVKQHVVECGMSYHDSNGRVGVVGVDTMIKRASSIGRWGDTVNKWIQDEGHHVLADNKWGKAAAMFGDAKGLAVTATPVRADGKGLGRHHDGLMDVMVQGPTMRELIDMGYLTDYKIFAPSPALIMDDSDMSDSTGDYKRTAVVKKFRANKNKIIGDVVEQYKKHANGKLGITFVPDVEDAIDTAKAYNDAGIPAEVVTAKTPAHIRAEIIRRFARRELLQLVNVDLFGEGFDLPAIEVVSMARPTASYSLFVQQFGRALRIMDGKIVALIIDHVGNVIRHGLPDAPRVWTLDRRDKRSRGEPDDTIPVKACPQCTGVYERVRSSCPYCGYHPEPVSRGGPEFVDGDLFEMDAETLAKMRGETAKVDGPPAIPYGASGVVQASVRKNHSRRQEMQSALRDSMDWWSGYQESLGRDLSESYRRFYFAFKIDVETAKSLGRPEALALANKINQHIGKLHNECSDSV